MPASSPKTNSPAVVGENVTIELGGNVIVDDVSFAINRGSVTAIIGPNGAGKTTLIRAILGFLKPTHGTIGFLDNDGKQTAPRFAYVPQRFDFDRAFPISVREFLQLATDRPSSAANVERALTDVALPTSLLPSSLGSLSGGQLQRVLLAHALLRQPSIIILDEPSSGVDQTGEVAIAHLLPDLAKRGMTVILVSHDLTMVADTVDEVLCLNRRLVCAGPPHKALSASALHDLYGAHAQHVDHDHP